jgi:biotin carboxyl carrier protein
MKKYFNDLEKKIERRPLPMFLTALGILLLLIVAGNKLRQPKNETKTEKAVKEVQIFSIGTAPKINTNVQVEKTGVIQINAPMSAVVYKINVKDGAKVAKGTHLISLANNYSGGNAMTVGRQLAEKQNQLVEATFDDQKDLITKQKESVEENYSNFEKIRDITNASIDDTKNSISLNNTVIATLNANIQNLSTDPVGNASLILSSQQMLSQFQSANNQLNSALRSSQYQADANNPPSKLSEDQKNITLKQLDIQSKSLDLSREISALQLKLARVNEAMMFPSAPSDGVVEQVLVRPGQQVNPGMPLLVFSSSSGRTLRVVSYLPKHLAENVSRTENSIFTLGSNSVQSLPSYVSREAVNGSLYSVIYFLPAGNYSNVTDKEYIKGQIPIGYPDSSASVIYVPLDNVYQTEEEAFVFKVGEDNVARSVKVKLGEVFGSFVRVEDGLSSGDKIIADRNVVEGDTVSIK